MVALRRMRWNPGPGIGLRAAYAAMRVHDALAAGREEADERAAAVKAQTAEMLAKAHRPRRGKGYYFPENLCGGPWT